MEGKMLIKASEDNGLAIETELTNVNLMDKFHILYCIEQVLQMNEFETFLYNKVGRNSFQKNSEHTMIDLSKLGGSL